MPVQGTVKTVTLTGEELLPLLNGEKNEVYSFGAGVGLGWVLGKVEVGTGNGDDTVVMSLEGFHAETDNKELCTFPLGEDGGEAVLVNGLTGMEPETCAKVMAQSSRDLTGCTDFEPVLTLVYSEFEMPE
mgnify:CR=1 FL=1|jgi:hypothetical protein